VIFPLLCALVFTLATLLACGLLSLGLLLTRVDQRRYWRRVLWLHLGLLPLHLFVTFPLVMGGLGSRAMVGTRGDESPYSGPRLLPDGKLQVQSWASLRAETDAPPPADLVAAAKARQRAIPSRDGVSLRAFRIEATQEPPRAVAILVHGLFRSAMEPEPVAAMLREQGCECWLVELRNFGGSSRAPFTLGARESDDVVAAVEYVRAQPGRANAPIVLFGVSFGTVAISLALPRLDGIAGVALDAPIDDMLPAAHRLFGVIAQRSSTFAIGEPWQSLVLRSLEWWSDIDLAALCPSDVLATLPHDLPVLVVGAGIDERAPPATVERLFARLPMPAERKRLWMVAESEHGRVFLDQPAAYAEHLRWLLEHLRR
jgi:alpha-beta hydrolase superfamily lysophospholipase